MTSASARGVVWLKALMGLLGGLFSLLLASTAFFHWHLQGPGPLLTPRFSFLRFVLEAPHHLRWILPFVLLSASIIPLRALQWQLTLKKRVPYRERYHLVAIGAFTHNAFPGKLGDLIRSFLLSRTQGIPFFQALGSVLVCKLLEFAALMLLLAASFLGPFSKMMGPFSSALRIALGLCLALVTLVVLLAHYAQPLSQALKRRGRWARASTVLHEIGEGLGTAKSFRGMLLALSCSLLPEMASSLGYGLGLQALGVPGGLFAGPVVLGAIALGQSAVGMPGGIGIYYFLTSWTARALGASEDQAAAYAALTHLATVVTQVAVGAVSLWVRKIRLSDLRSSTRKAAEAARHLEALEAADA